ncbi:M48 family metalloprotease [Novosphingobium sp. 9]|uniref:M48 family metalloprotease n=1 Tax=Novosphingobium sp. 9 TaxID=2025349 RepID=UPI0021B4E5DC|nr:M48 family metalloprotease [Novosphingobium sp. 9]
MPNLLPNLHRSTTLPRRPALSGGWKRAGAALAVLCAFAGSAVPVAAQTVLRDAETEAFLHDLSAPLIKASGLDPNNVDVVLVNDPEVNAFVAGGQVVYVNSGLVNMADSAAEVQGVIAHELGHVAGGHAIYNPGASDATRISILSLLLGAAAAAAGSPAAGMGVFAAGQQAAAGTFLSYTRSQEASADAAGASYLSKAGISGRGSLAFFNKLLNMEYRYGYSQKDQSSFWSTHPLTADRIQTLSDTYEHDPAWTKPDDPAMQTRFLRIKAKLFGYLATPADTLKVYPETDNSIPALYARAYAYHKESLLDRALADADALLTTDPKDPYFLELKGQILLEAGHPAEAIDPLRQATQLSNNQPLIATLFGHAMLSTEDPAHYAEAQQVLKDAVARDRENPFAWYQLGVIYARNGDIPRARLASAEQQSLTGEMGEALINAQAAEAGLPTGSPDWLHAQDIEFQARAELGGDRKK